MRSCQIKALTSWCWTCAHLTCEPYVCLSTECTETTPLVSSKDRAKCHGKLKAAWKYPSRIPNIVRKILQDSWECLKTNVSVTTLSFKTNILDQWFVRRYRWQNPRTTWRGSANGACAFNWSRNKRIAWRMANQVAQRTYAVAFAHANYQRLTIIWQTMFESEYVTSSGIYIRLFLMLARLSETHLSFRLRLKCGNNVHWVMATAVHIFWPFSRARYQLPRLYRLDESGPIVIRRDRHVESNALAIHN